MTHFHTSYFSSLFWSSIMQNFVYLYKKNEEILHFLPTPWTMTRTKVNIAVPMTQKIIRIIKMSHLSLSTSSLNTALLRIYSSPQERSFPGVHIILCLTWQIQSLQQYDRLQILRFKQFTLKSLNTFLPSEL